MHYGDREKNPFFLPALIAALIPVVFFFAVIFGISHLILIAPYVALILSITGLVYAFIWKTRFKGCVFCLVLSILEMFIPAYLSHNLFHTHTIATYSLSPEESASAESIHEEINRALYGNTVTRTTK